MPLAKADLPAIIALAKRAKVAAADDDCPALLATLHGSDGAVSRDDVKEHSPFIPGLRQLLSPSGYVDDRDIDNAELPRPLRDHLGNLWALVCGCLVDAPGRSNRWMVEMLDQFIEVTEAHLTRPKPQPGRPRENEKLQKFIEQKLRKNSNLGPKDLLAPCRDRFPERHKERPITIRIIRGILHELRKPAANKKRP